MSTSLDKIIRPPVLHKSLSRRMDGSFERQRRSGKTTHSAESQKCVVLCRFILCYFARIRANHLLLPDKLPVLHAPIEPEEPGAANAGKALAESVAAKDGEIGIGDAAGE